MTTGTPFLALWLMIFLFNILRQRIPTIFKMPLDPNILSQSIWKLQSTLESSYIGTMCTEPLHFQCQMMCTRLCTYFNTFWGVSSSTPPVPVPQSNMDRQSNMQTLWMHYSTSQKKKPTSFNKLLALSYTMPSISTTPFSLPSVTFPRNSPRPRRAQQNRWPKSWAI